MPLIAPYSSTYWPQEDEVLGILTSESAFQVIFNFTSDNRGSESMTDNVVTLSRGDSRTIKVVVRSPALDVVNLDGCRAVMMVRRRKDDTSALLLKDTDVTGQGEINTPNMGDIRFFFRPSDTELLTASQYYFTVAVITATPNTYTVAEGYLVINTAGVISTVGATGSTGPAGA